MKKDTEFEIKTKIEQEFKDLSKNFAVILFVDLHVYNQSCLFVSEYLIKKLKLKGLYVALNKPYETICGELKKNNLDVNAISCIDAVSKETDKYPKIDKVLYLEDPSSITELLFLIKAVCNEGKIKFIFLDSLDTLLLYNDIKEVEKFIRSLVNKARKSNVSVVIMSPKEKSEEDMLAAVTQFCDKEIEL